MPVELGNRRKEKRESCRTRKQTSQTSQFHLGPAPSRALKSGFYTRTVPHEIQIPICTKRSSSKEQIRKQILLEPLLIAVPLSAHCQGKGLTYFIYPRGVCIANDQGRK